MGVSHTHTHTHTPHRHRHTQTDTHAESRGETHHAPNNTVCVGGGRVISAVSERGNHRHDRQDSKGMGNSSTPPQTVMVWMSVCWSNALPAIFGQLRSGCSRTALSGPRRGAAQSFLNRLRLRWQRNMACGSKLLLFGRKTIVDA